MNSRTSIFISAGDPSADYYGQSLIEEVTRACGRVTVFGLGGKKMQEAGLKPLADYKELAVLGFWEVLPKFFFFRNLLTKAAKEIELLSPKAIILMDYPGFNLRLAEKVKHLGIPIIYYISPQVWAWGKGRIAKIKRLVDLMLVIFPFEEQFYKEHGVNAVFSGHPIVDRYAETPDKTACRENLGMKNRTIGLLPGSRIQEVKRMLPSLIGAAKLMRYEIDDVQFIIAGVDNVPEHLYKNIIGDADIPVVVGRTPEIMNGSELVIVSSGTATIETAFFKTPMVVIYKTGALTYQIAKRLVKLDTIGMVNIVAGRKIVPELIQDKATAESISDTALEIIQDKARYAQMIIDIVTVKEKLGAGSSALRAFKEINKAVGLC
ncbi:MAG: lipid-A-disaccharide synthase [candidate division Zixibacteria bacterium]|nr:lipid-A-disaccharide synthase [candidate division Zixibacteria bacterium]